MFNCAIFILSAAILAQPIGANFDNDDVWLEPNAWEIHSPSPKTCPVCDIPDVISHENSITTMYYKQMVAQLFNKDNLKVNPKTNHLERTIILSLTAAQLKIIENSSDIRDFNSVVMAVLTSAKEPVYEKKLTSTNNESPFWILKYTWESFYSITSHIVRFFSNVYSHSSEIRFAMLVCAVMMAIWAIHKRYNKNLIVLVIISGIMFGYFCSYVECNRKLEAEKFIKFVKESEPDEPNFLSKFLGNLFKKSKKDQQIEELINQSKVKFAYCRPDEVALLYFNEMFFNQLKVVIEQMVDSMNIIRNTIPFPFNYMGMIALPLLFMSLLPLLFQYTFNPLLWYKIFRDPSGTKHYHQTKEMINNNAHQGDRLSGDNLKILFEVLKNKTEIEEKPKNSAVEDVKDIQKAITAKLDDDDELLSAEEKSNKDKSVVRIEDILEDDSEESKKES